MSDVTGYNDASKDSPWFSPSGPKLDATGKRVFGDYAGVPPEKLEQHLLEQRDKAWSIAPWVCVGLWGFTGLEISSSSEYQEVVERVKAGELLLDIGTGIGQDLRLLTADGCASENLYAVDAKKDFFDVGYGMFNDGDTFKAHFTAAELPQELGNLAHMKGKLSFIHAGYFFHCFDLEAQKEMAVYLLTLLKGQGSNGVIFGRQAGSRLESRWQTMGLRSCYRFTPSALEDFWRAAAEKVGLKVEVKAYLREMKNLSQADAKTLPVLQDDPLVKVMFSVRIP